MENSKNSKKIFILIINYEKKEHWHTYSHTYLYYNKILLKYRTVSEAQSTTGHTVKNCMEIMKGKQIVKGQWKLLWKKKDIKFLNCAKHTHTSTHSFNINVTKHDYIHNAVHISFYLNVQQIIAIAAQKKLFAVNWKTEKRRERKREREGEKPWNCRPQ